GEGVLVVERPAADAISVVDLTNIKHVVLDFSMQGVKVAVLDVDVVLLFPDGGKVILPGFAFAMVALEAPTVTATDGPIDSQSFRSLVGETKIADQLPTIRLTDLEQHEVKADYRADDPISAGKGPGETDEQQQPPPQPVKTDDTPPTEYHNQY